MLVLYVAPFLHSYGSENHLARDMQRLPDVSVLRVRERDGDWFADPVSLIEQATNADLVLYTKGFGLLPEMTEAWRKIEANGTLTASWHLDKYVGLAREYEVGNDPFWHTGTVFTADGDPHSAHYFDQHGVNHRWLPPAVVSDECTPGNSYSGAPPVVFVGSRTYHPEWPWRGELIDGLEARYGDRFACYGQQGRIHGQVLNDLYASTRVVVGDSLNLPGGANFTSDRLPEVLGRGGFLVYPRIPGVVEAFGLIDGYHCRFYDAGDLDGLCAIIDYYLAHPAEARSIAARGQAHIAANHTYVHRARALLNTLGLR